MKVHAVNDTRKKTLATDVREAKDFAARFLGLMGRRALGDGEALHLVPCDSIHTFFMRMVIDVAFLDAEGRIVKTVERLPPWRVVWPCRTARSALELQAGVLATVGAREGDQVLFQSGTT